MSRFCAMKAEISTWNGKPIRHGQTFVFEEKWDQFGTHYYKVYDEAQTIYWTFYDPEFHEAFEILGEEDKNGSI